ncbi:uncharacterized protein LOC123516686 [Portunus trituberculatus]|uniref:uncharacterized protein LOC123516686 n=1 Tax=Portunus trituberculatus TaxID=210409 RepID=UPI001E1D059C|nr:uncharacterized protein LOC123516686 [Portunus trituberculatus]
MDGIHDDSSQWEQSKENIQPLKQGRKAAVLSAVLDDSAANKLNIMRHEFEEELRTYSGNDPLDVWYRYVLWVEQNYPRGGKEGKLTKLIENCVMAMYSSADVREKYVNDERFLDIWIKYANLSTNPPEIYQTMEAKNLCLSLADFYINWAWEMEKIGNYKRADAIYEKGLQAGAKPLCSLQESHKKFQIRVSRSTIEGRIGDQEINSSEQQRVALSALKSQGHRVGVNRSGPALAGPAGRCVQDLPSKINGPAFSIFKDTSTQGVPSNIPSDDKSTLSLGAPTNQENVRKPNQWSKSKVKQKAVNVVPVEDVDKYHKPEFSVHEDEDTSQYSRIHSRLSTASNVLTQHKQEYDNWHVQLFIPEPFDPKIQPQYCKHKVYCGTEEFSFEELMAARYTKSQREKQEKECELQQMRDMLKKQEEMIQKLLKLKSEEKEDKSVKPVAPPNPPPSSQPRVSHQKARKELKSSIIYQDSWLAINKSVNASINASNLHDESGNILLRNEPLMPVGYGKESISNDLVPPTVINEQGSLSTSGNSRGLSFTDPTGDAANIMHDIWSATLSNSMSHHFGDMGARLSEPASSEDLAPIYEDECKKDEGPAFQIFSDLTQDQKTEPCGMPQLTRVLKEKPAAMEVSTATKTPDVAPIQPEIEPTSSDAENYPEMQDENCPPVGTVLLPHKNRHMSGVLQPAKCIPIPQDQETEDVKSVEIEEKNFECKQPNDTESLYVSTMKNEDLDDIVPLDDKQMEDFTIKMPNNEAIFSHMAKVASTPLPWSQGYLAHSSTSRNDFTITSDTDKHFPLIQEKKPYSLLKNNHQIDMMPPPSTTKAQTHANVTTTATLPYAESETGLSVIMEASQELRSSSSSSGCTTSNTLPGHSVHGLSHPGNFSLSTVHVSRVHHQSQPEEELPCESAPPLQVGDFTKSGYLADKSRGESLAESLPCTTIAAQPKNVGLSMSTCSTAAKMMMEFDAMMSFSDFKKDNCDGFRNINPFDEEVIENILSNLAVPLDKRGGYVAIMKDIPHFKPGLQAMMSPRWRLVTSITFTASSLPKLCESGIVRVCRHKREALKEVVEIYVPQDGAKDRALWNGGLHWLGQESFVPNSVKSPSNVKGNDEGGAAGVEGVMPGVTRASFHAAGQVLVCRHWRKMCVRGFVSSSAQCFIRKGETSSGPGAFLVSVLQKLCHGGFAELSSALSWLATAKLPEAVLGRDPLLCDCALPLLHKGPPLLGISLRGAGPCGAWRDDASDESRPYTWHQQLAGTCSRTTAGLVDRLYMPSVGGHDCVQLVREEGEWGALLPLGAVQRTEQHSSPVTGVKVGRRGQGAGGLVVAGLGTGRRSMGAGGLILAWVGVIRIISTGLRESLIGVPRVLQCPLPLHPETDGVREGRGLPGSQGRCVRITLLFCYRYRSIGKTMPEDIAMFFMVEILSILEAVHNCDIIHADIKPDNFLVQAIPESNMSDDIFTEDPMSLKLIDFGRSIDMKAFPEGTTFTEVVTTEKFTCCEMKDGQPWTYQTDYYGAAAIAHLFLFGTYMDLKKTASGKWSITGVFKRYWNKNLWENVFSTLLNVPSCSALPNLSALRNEIITAFYEAGMQKDIHFKFHTLKQMEVAQK